MQALRALLQAMTTALQAILSNASGADFRSVQPRLRDDELKPSAHWKAKVVASRRTEALAQAISPQLPEGVRPYLRRLVLQDEYPGSLQELCALSREHRRNLDRLFLHGCAPMDEYEEARAVGPAFEQALAQLIAAKHEA
jgi:hypothetical protein